MIKVLIHSSNQNVLLTWCDWEGWEKLEHTLHPWLVRALMLQMSSSGPAVLEDFVFNVIRLSWRLISPALLCLPSDHHCCDLTVTHTHTYCTFSAWLVLAIVSAGVYPPPQQASLYYLGWQNTQGISLLCSDILVWSISVPASHCFQWRASDVSFCTKQMNAVRAKQKN